MLPVELCSSYVERERAGGYPYMWQLRPKLSNMIGSSSKRTPWPYANYGVDASRWVAELGRGKPSYVPTRIITDPLATP